MIKYLDFINEAKISEIKVGDRVIFYGKFNIYPGIINLDKKTGVVKSIKKNLYIKEITFELDEILKINYNYGKPISEIILSSYQLRNVLILNDKTENTINKINKGELYKFKSSKNFSFILRNIKFQKNGEYFDMSYFDIIKEKPDYVTFIPSKKINEFDGNEEKLEKYKQETRVGRILKKLNNNYTEKEIEEFVNKFKASHASIFTDPQIDVVTGDKISYWYNEIRYKKPGGSLNNSCMRHENNKIQIDFYGEYKNKIALAILIKEEQLWARALIWRLDDGRIYMDRIYSVNETSRVILENYALNNNMLLYKNLFKSNMKISVTLDENIKNKYINTPYFDTFIIDYRKFSDNNILILNNKIF